LHLVRLNSQEGERERKRERKRERERERERERGERKNEVGVKEEGELGHRIFDWILSN
jgi:hypothetical protein